MELKEVIENYDRIIDFDCYQIKQGHKMSKKYYEEILYFNEKLGDIEDALRTLNIHGVISNKDFKKYCDMFFESKEKSLKQFEEIKKIMEKE